MLQTIEHRGRDDEGVWTSPAIDEAKRQTRAWAIAVSQSSTPAARAISRWFPPMAVMSITFGGEIYNYRELRERTEEQGPHFSTETDTEVLLTAFAEWGNGCLPRLNGMFHFAVWDNQERTLTLARDHVGIKPLYYFHKTRAVRPTGFVHFCFGS